MRMFHHSKVPFPPNFRSLPLRLELPLDVEIGCGVGFHPLQYAREHPERQILAIERTKRKFQLFEGRIRRHPPLPNLIPIHGDAVAWISHALGRESVDRYFLLYPNPYPKERQRNLRFHNMPFFAWLVETMKPGGTFTMATNESFLREEASERIPQELGLRLRENVLISRDSKPRSHFEKKYLERGGLCWNLVFEKERGFERS